MRLGQAPQLREELALPAQLELCGQPLLECDEAQLLEALGLGVGEVLVGQLTVGLPPPERERAAETRRGKARIALPRGLPPFGEETFEARRVERAVEELE